MDYVVVDHHFDADREVYVLVIGYAQEQEVPALDEAGNVRRGPDQKIVEDGEERVIPGEPLTEMTTVLVPSEDFVFSGVDPKWDDKSPDEIVRSQKATVRAALRARETAVDTSHLRAMPGVGDGL